MFENIELWVLVALCVAAFGAGLIDAMVGGGGLIQIPALFGLMPGQGHATLLGTNKISSVVGTTFAAYKYAKAIQVPWNAVLPATIMALIGAYCGAYIVTQISTEVLRLMLPLLLIAVAIYTFLRKALGSVHAPKLDKNRERFFGACVGLAIGFYDGFFGPGTGSFLMVAFVVFFGFDFLAATAGAKMVNIACNLASLAWDLEVILSGDGILLLSPVLQWDLDRSGINSTELKVLPGRQDPRSGHIGVDRNMPLPHPKKLNFIFSLLVFSAALPLPPQQC